jgi:Xaa-Pro aminopeptidase
MRFIRQIKGEAAIFCSPPLTTLTRDQHHPFRQNSDLLYLTGIEEPEIALVLLGGSQGARSVLFLRDRDAVAELWGDSRIGLRRARRNFQIDEVKNIDSLEKELKEVLKGIETLHYALGSNPRLDRFVTELSSSPVGPRAGLPHTLKDPRIITAEMRFVKDRDEIALLRHAVDITAHSLLRVAPRLRTAKSELHAARMIECEMAELGAERMAFETIVASGKNATILHHRPTLQPLWKGEPVLIDCGAGYRFYSGDITRVLPPSGKLVGPAREIYLLVLRALGAAKKRARPGASLADMHESAVSEITRGLHELKILRGKPADSISSKAYTPFFPHRIGHWLGIDVHDISPLYQRKNGTNTTAWERPLVPGVACTVEPGLYFHPEDERVPKRFRGIGVRLEDSVLITENGVEVLSEQVPLELHEIEEMLG